jgi:Ni,Fe-hydrogenase I large subunit
LPTRPDAYTWCKAPRYGSRVVETGALARQMVDGHPLLRALVAANGGSVLARVVARLFELALVVPAMEGWVRALTPGEPFCHPVAAPRSGQRRRPRRSRARRPRSLAAHRTRQDRPLPDHRPDHLELLATRRGGVPGALEQALVGLPVGEGESVPLAVQHVVRSFDPCMVCTVH